MRDGSLTHKVLRLKNPWGRSLDDPKDDEKDMAEKKIKLSDFLKSQECKGKEHGEFFVDYDQYMTIFRSTSIARVRPTYTYKGIGICRAPSMWKKEVFFEGPFTFAAKIQLVDPSSMTINFVQQMTRLASDKDYKPSPVNLMFGKLDTSGEVSHYLKGQSTKERQVSILDFPEPLAPGDYVLVADVDFQSSPQS